MRKDSRSRERFFFDTSALAKRYIQESGSDRVEEILALASALSVSVLCLTEVISALCRLRREDRLSKQRYAEAKRALLHDFEDMTVLSINAPVLTHAVSLLERWPIRSSDALHIASAVEWSAQLFVSADKKQCAAAQGCGLPVEWLC